MEAEWAGSDICLVALGVFIIFCVELEVFIFGGDRAGWLQHELFLWTLISMFIYLMEVFPFFMFFFFSRPFHELKALYVHVLFSRPLWFGFGPGCLRPMAMCTYVDRLRKASGPVRRAFLKNTLPIKTSMSMIMTSCS